jgi:hypothetical protein
LVVLRSRVLGLVAVLALAAAGAFAPVAVAQGGPQNPILPGPQNPFQPGLPQEQATIPTQTQTAPLVIPTTSSSSSSGISGSVGLAIGIGALLVLAGISFFIWRDARRRAPVRAAAAGAPVNRTPGSKRVKPRKLSPAERRRRKRGRAR